ncbi:MAG: lysylphosphatidylglycerol synthase transmembrane domain-containing protein [Candidatus Njordarchaeia archaeon]
MVEESKKVANEHRDLEGVIQRAKRFVPITIMVVFGIVFAYAFITRVNIDDIVNLPPYVIVSVLLLIVITPFFGGLRLHILAKLLNVNCYKEAYLTRTASQFIALVTPGASGAQFVKAYWIEKNGPGWAKGLGLANVETLFDVIFVNIIALVVSFNGFLSGEFGFVFVILLSLNSLSYYIILFSISLIPPIRRSVLSLLKKFRIKIDEESLENISYILKKLKESPRTLLVAIIITLIMLFLQGLTIVMVGLAFGVKLDPLYSFIFISIIQVMGGSPTPAGAIAVEYGASLLVSPDMVVVWRVLVFTFAIIYYFIAFQLFVWRYRRGKITI